MSEATHRPAGIRGRIVLVLAGVLGAYLICESGADLYDYWLPPERNDFAFSERSDLTNHFDPIRGFFLTSTPARFARIVNGEVTYIGLLRGNSVGFSDPKDFGPRRSHSGSIRIAVFGDSFTAGNMLKRNWPSQVEELLAARGRDVELLNFALDGGGLANWWSLLTRLVEADNYEIDGVIFAVWPGDLDRLFLFADDQGQEHFASGAATSWDPATFPRSIEEARPLLGTHPNTYILSTEDFERTLQTKQLPKRVFRLVLWSKLKKVPHWLTVKLCLNPSTPPAELPPPLNAGQLRLIRDMKRFLDSRHLPVMVVLLPRWQTVLGTDPSVHRLESTKLFAAELGARFVDGSVEFAKFTRAEQAAYWLHYDQHWNQKGSDLFAGFMLKTLINDTLLKPEVTGSRRPELRPERSLSKP